jgi:hypothetical protein
VIGPLAPDVMVRVYGVLASGDAPTVGSSTLTVTL